MVISRSWLRIFAVAVVLAVGAGAVMTFSADWQLRRAFGRLVSAVSDRKIEKIKGMLADDYRDQWGMDRGQAARGASVALQNFLAVEVVAGDARFARKGAEATVRAHLRILGRGNQVGEAIKDRVNALRDEFRFAWERKSWKPWDWKLVSVQQSEIQFDPDEIP